MERPTVGTCESCGREFAISPRGRIPSRCKPCRSATNDLSDGAEPEPQVCRALNCQIPISDSDPAGEWCRNDWKQIPLEIRGEILSTPKGSKDNDRAVLGALRALKARASRAEFEAEMEEVLGG